MTEYKKVFFIGIGGIGMSGLARYLHSTGVCVLGYDRTQTELTAQMESEGMLIQYDTNTDSLPDDIELVVYTPAVLQENPICKWFVSQSVPMVKRAKLLSQIAEQYQVIAVAGTHGKTSTSAAITHILAHANQKILAFVGGIMKNYNSNYVLSKNPIFCVVEADEYDHSFLQLFPDIAVITSIDADHLDIYNNYDSLKNAFQQFASQSKQGALLILHENIRNNIHVDNRNTIVYGKSAHSDVQISTVRQTSEGCFVDVRYREQVIREVFIPVCGLHNLENMIAAMIVAVETGMQIENFREVVASFAGVKRRFDIRVNLPHFVYIDDYAHHPKEIDACIAGVRECFTNRKITGVFQPHLYTRTRDFAVDFAKSLEKLDRVILTDIYPAREEPIQGIDAIFLFDKIEHKHKIFVPKNELIKYIESLDNIELLLTMGAGDIDALVPQFEQLFKSKN
jgi:UDP-N-acetylmuramate--alanine ligase